jgi:DnaJ-domain-containing protein 1
MTPDEQTASILQVSLLLREPDLREEYLLVAADLALHAKDRGSPGEIDSFMQLMIAAADQSAFRAAFINAKRFLDGYESRSF